MVLEITTMFSPKLSYPLLVVSTLRGQLRSQQGIELTDHGLGLLGIDDFTMAFAGPCEVGECLRGYCSARTSQTGLCVRQRHSHICTQSHAHAAVAAHGTLSTWQGVFHHLSVLMVVQQSMHVAVASIIPDSLCGHIERVSVPGCFKMLLCMATSRHVTANEATHEAYVNAIALPTDITARRLIWVLLKSANWARGVTPPKQAARMECVPTKNCKWHSTSQLCELVVAWI
mmetsp:Transcript_27228/g.49946  ORF Transcript_27228/g.49946 Transcript_27228/m.49946 type:complete len:230 (-) Transcript_27228:407-1096(-)